MALTATAPDGAALSTKQAQYVGGRRVIECLVTFDTDYLTGGEVLAPSLIGLTRIDTVRADGPTSAAKPVYPLFDATTGSWLLKVFSAIGTQVASSVDLHTESVLLTVVGT